MSQADSWRRPRAAHADGAVMPRRQDLRRRLLSSAVRRCNLTLDELWSRYFALGGTADPDDLDAFLEGTRPLDELQQDVLTRAVNERLDQVFSRTRVPYSREIRPALPEAGPLAGLVALLRGTHLAPPDRLPVVLAAAAEALDLHAVLYLIDHADVKLVPWLPAGVTSIDSIGLEGTVCGRAFRTMSPVAQTIAGRPHLWVPVVDGAERLGVLDLALAHERDQEDPALHEQVWWLAHYLGHLVTVIGQVGDGVEIVRRRQHPSVTAELVRQLVPPQTAGTERVVVTAKTEPSVDVGGDVFDYALSERVAQFAVIDADGGDIASGLVAAAALAGYRNARREQRPLFDQAQAMHDVLGDLLAVPAFANGLVAELDLVTGLFRYINAGQPAPLLLRRGRMVRSLTGGRRARLGVESSAIVVGEEQLEPGDRVVLLTDGVVSALDDAGTPLGLSGLADLLVRESDAETPLPEVLRRLAQEILRRQAGLAHDDFTIMLISWSEDLPRTLSPFACP